MELPAESELGQQTDDAPTTSLGMAAEMSRPEEPIAEVELVLHPASDEPIGQIMDRQTLLERIHEIMSGPPPVTEAAGKRIRIRQEAAQLALISYGVLDNSPDQLARYNTLFPVIEGQVDDMPLSKAMDLFEQLEVDKENSILNLFADYLRDNRGKTTNIKEIHTIQRTAAFLMVQFTET